MAQKRRHHYVPQFYLRGFSDPATPAGHTPFLWVLDKHSGAVARRAPQNLAHAIGFYAANTPQGVDYETLENELSQIESRAAFELRRYLSAEEGKRGAIQPGLATFISWLAARVPAFRRAAEEQWSDFLLAAAHGETQIPDDSDFRCMLRERGGGTVLALPLPDALAAIRSEAWSPCFSTSQYAEVMRVQVWYFRFKHFPALAWTFLTAPDGFSFVTSDRPVVWQVPGAALSDNPGALRHPDVQLTLPLSPRHALLGTPKPPPPGFGISVAEVNQRTIEFAEKFVVGSSASLLGS